MAQMDFARTWLPYLYQYAVGGIIFFLGFWLIWKSGAANRQRRSDRFWLYALLFGFVWFMALHGGSSIAALNSGPVDASVGAGSEVAGKPSPMLFFAIVIGYIVAVLGFGAYFARYNKSTSDFFFGGRRFSWWLIMISIVATGVGSHSFLKYSAKGFQHGFSASMTYTNDWFFMPLFMFGWLPIVYFTGIKSIPEYFEKRFNRPARILATIAILGYMLGYIAIGFLTMAKTLQPVLVDFMGFNLGLDAIVWTVAIVAGVYITFGGQTAVIFTDLLQGIILIIGGFLLFFLGLNWLGGFDAFWGALPASFKMPLAHFNEPQDFNFVGVFWQDGVAGSIGFLFLNQGLIMRFMACRSVNEGRKAVAGNALFLLPLSAIVVCNAGWVGRAISTARPDILSPDAVPDEVFTRVAAIVSSPMVFAFLIAAVVAALMSTVDTLINAVAAITINDIYRPIVKNRKDKHYLKAAMLFSALATLIGVLATYPFRSFATLYEAHAKFHTTLTPPLVAAVFLGVFWRRYTSKAVIATFIGGVALMVLGQVFPEYLIAPLAHGVKMDAVHPFKYMAALYNLLVCFGVGIVVALVTKAPSTARMDGLTVFSLERARELFKGGKPNYRTGKKVWAGYTEDASLAEGTVAVSPGAMETMAAEPGDMVYVTDRRWWLGGLRSTHAKLAPSREGDSFSLAPDVLGNGHYVPGTILRIEKEF